tara:strand:- start:2389 stop:2715 length:327 start_codon:yes stop_codon:yes gene_type:complete
MGVPIAVGMVHLNGTPGVLLVLGSLCHVRASDTEQNSECQGVEGRAGFQDRVGDVFHVKASFVAVGECSQQTTYVFRNFAGIAISCDGIFLKGVSTSFVTSFSKQAHR